jgi:RND superfamily putative drug exporter
MPVRPAEDAEPTEKFEAQPPEQTEPQSDEPQRPRRGGGVSAQDLLRREGRI